MMFLYQEEEFLWRLSSVQISLTTEIMTDDRRDKSRSCNSTHFIWKWKSGRAASERGAYQNCGSLNHVDQPVTLYGVCLQWRLPHRQRPWQTKMLRYPENEYRRHPSLSFLLPHPPRQPRGFPSHVHAECEIYLKYFILKTKQNNCIYTDS